MSTTKRALIVIDLQNDYFSEGRYPLWNTEATLSNVEQAISKAQSLGWTIVLVQHVANAKLGLAPFFNEGSNGVDIHPRILAAAPDAPIVVKQFADSFHHTTLEQVLQQRGVEELFICGMMTQNCVTHTAISRAAEKYRTTILSDCCTTVDAMIHNIALNAVSTRLNLATWSAAIE